MAPRRKHDLAQVLGPLESEIMDVVWELGEVTVRDVHRALTSTRPIAYTTVMTTLGRLSDKGFLVRVENQPAHHYTPRVTRDQYARSAVKSVVDWLLNHFPEPAVTYLIDRAREEDDRMVDRLQEAIDRRKEKGD